MSAIGKDLILSTPTTYKEMINPSTHYKSSITIVFDRKNMHIIKSAAIGSSAMAGETAIITCDAAQNCVAPLLQQELRLYQQLYV